MVKSNPPVLEWLSSPIIYKQHPVIDTLRTAGETFFDPVSTSHHYHSMAIKNYKYIQDELVIRKKYLYILRPLFCIEWISVHRTMPPMEFDDLVAFSLDKTPDDQLAHAIKSLIAEKKAGKEKEKQSRDAILDAFIQRRLSDHQSADFGKSKPANYELADATFRTILQQLAK
jgi:predicted nucleotidyltransferase